MVYRCLNFLNGETTVARAFGGDLTKVLAHCGLSPCVFDSKVYSAFTEEGDEICVASIVDDLIGRYSSSVIHLQFLDKLRQFFDVTGGDNSGWVLKIRLDYDIVGGRITLSCEARIAATLGGRVSA